MGVGVDRMGAGATGGGVESESGVSLTEREGAVGRRRGKVMEESENVPPTPHGATRKCGGRFPFVRPAGRSVRRASGAWAGL